MAFRIIAGLAITAACFAVAGRRFWWLSRLIRSGKEAPRRWRGFSRASSAELVEVAGQRKLLQWTVPGIAHFFTMWGFTVLLATIIEVYRMTDTAHPVEYVLHDELPPGAANRHMLAEPELASAHA